MEPLTDPLQTIPAAIAGDRHAWEALVGAWLPAVIQWGRRLGGPRVDPCDVAQDTFIIVYARLTRLYDPACFPAWLYGITRRVVAQHRRRVGCGAGSRAWMSSITQAARMARGGASRPSWGGGPDASRRIASGATRGAGAL